MFHCRFCPFTCEKLKQHLDHGAIHSNLNSNLFCGFNRCKKYYQVEVSLRAHLTRSHNFRFKHVNLAATKPKILARIADVNAKYQCSMTLCKKVFDNHFTLVKHLKQHIRNGIKIQCPFDVCKKVYDKVNSFTSHLSKNHRRVEITDNTLVIDANSSSFNEQPDIFYDNDEQSFDVGGSAELTIETTSNSEVVRKESTPTQLLLRHLAQFFMKLETYFLIPVTYVEYIISQICSTHENGQEVVKNKLLERLVQENIPSEQANEIINQALLCDPFLQIQNTFLSSHKRTKFYTENFPYVRPIQVWLGDKSNKAHFFHYVPIEKTLVQLFNNKSLEDELRTGTPEGKDNILKDFTDGSVFKQNKFFHENPNGLKLILYQDSFEVVNPLGAAKTQYKLLAVYLSIGNLSDHIRSHINSMQLVALYREKFFNHEKVYERIVKYLKKIETKGVELPSGEIIRGSTVFIVGDNLGSHSLGGFVENFSTSQYFCRYCLMRRDQFYHVDGASRSYARRTVDCYKRIVERIENSELNQNFDHEGIKFNSIFNQLKFYHTSTPGLPPCLGHDILECLIAYDGKLYIDDLVKKKWFSYKILNQRINSFKYSNDDKKDKPCTISQTANKITGGAWQLWTFLRLLPLMIEDKIQDKNDVSWRCLILLTEIVEIITAPQIHKSCIYHLKIIIDEYIYLRQQLQEPLRPKYHFLCHYPELIFEFRPLMKVWILRFESKHTFFKRVIRSIKNFTNVTKSLSIKHELSQSFIRSGGDIRSEIEVGKKILFQARLYNEKSQEAVKSVNLPDEIQECDKIIIKGVQYVKGDALFTAQENYQYNVEVGRILFLSSDEENVFFIVEVLETRFLAHLRAYELGKFLRYECLPLHLLTSTEKLNIYNIGNFLCVKPNHGLVKTQL